MYNEPLECYSAASEWFAAIVLSHMTMPSLSALDIAVAGKEEAEAEDELQCWIYSIRKISWSQWEKGKRIHG